MTEIYVSLGDLTADQLVRLREAAGDDVLHVQGKTDPALAEAFARCEIAFGNVDAEWLGSPKLRWVQLESVGFGEYAELDWDELGERLTLTNLAGFFTEPVAESVLAGILALHRGIDRVVRLKSARQWQGDALRQDLRLLKQARVVLFGHGAINRRLEELLAPFDCAISSHRTDWKEGALDEALAGADIVVSAVPDTAATRGVFGRERLAQLPAGAIFVNVGRGSVVDEDALADALVAGRLAGAIVDVTLAEPLPETHRFWECPNMILTQHSGGGFTDEIDRKIDMFAANLARYRSGRPLIGKVDFKRGY